MICYLTSKYLNFNIPFSLQILFILSFFLLLESEINNKHLCQRSKLACFTAIIGDPPYSNARQHHILNGHGGQLLN